MSKLQTHNCTLLFMRSWNCNKIINFHILILQVAWLHSQKGIIAVFPDMLAQNDRFSSTFDNRDSWMLNIERVQESDAGKYICQLNTEKPISISGTLSVVGRMVQIDQMLQELKVGQDKTKNFARIFKNPIEYECKYSRSWFCFCVLSPRSSFQFVWILFLWWFGWLGWNNIFKIFTFTLPGSIIRSSTKVWRKCKIVICAIWLIYQVSRSFQIIWFPTSNQPPDNLKGKFPK